MKKIEDAVRRLGGVWPSDDADAVYLYKIANRHIAGLPGGTAHCVCTRTEFEACTRRLRNEPSWSDAPDWAVSLAQDSGGEWYWYGDKPIIRDYHARWLYSAGIHRYAKKGEVIGDWKQTLRLRPEEDKMEDENDWYKKGEFPPVGTVCEMRRRGEGFAKGSLMYHSAELCVWRFMSSAEIAIRPDQCEFRPLQTERERWVEMARKATFEADEKQNYYEAIYDAGLAKMPEDK